MTVIPHPPYSPDLAPCDFFLFPKLKLRMKGRRFDTIEEIQEESQRVLYSFPKRDFQGYFQAWQKRWDRCIRAKGGTLKVMEELNIQGKQTSFYKYCPGTLEFILVISSHQCPSLTSGLFPSGFATKTFYTLLFSPYVLHAPSISFFSI